MSLAFWLRSDWCRFSGEITQPLAPLTAVCLYFWSNGYIIVYTEPSSKLRNRETLSGPLHFLKFLLSHRQLLVLDRGFCDHITSILLTNWLHCALNSSKYHHKWVVCAVLDVFHSSVFLWQSKGLTFGVWKILESLLCMSYVCATSLNV